MTYSVTLEHGSDGSYLAWVHELPGCFARGADRAEVEAKLPEAIREFATWAGEPVGDFTVVDEVESVVNSSEDTEVLLQPDREPLTEADWQRIERLLERSRAESLRALDGLDVQHIGFGELMYAAWTFDVDSPEFMEWTRRVVLERMRDVAQRDNGAVTEARWAGAPRPEPWTARKAARRLVWHERLHLPAGS